jgi:hypothetical protein
LTTKKLFLPDGPISSFNKNNININKEKKLSDIKTFAHNGLVNLKLRNNINDELNKKLTEKNMQSKIGLNCKNRVTDNLNASLFQDKKLPKIEGIK